MPGLINLRKEINNLFFNTEGGIANWIMLRHFNKGILSEYWDPNKNEAVGGPMYTYIDVVLSGVSAFAYSTSRVGDIGLRRIEPGAIVTEKRKLYVQWDTTIEIDDEIYELSAHTTNRPTIVYDRTKESVSTNKVYPKTRWMVQDIVDYRSDDRGRIEYKMLILERK